MDSRSDDDGVRGKARDTDARRMGHTSCCTLRTGRLHRCMTRLVDTLLQRALQPPACVPSAGQRMNLAAAKGLYAACPSFQAMAALGCVQVRSPALAYLIHSCESSRTCSQA